MKTLLVQDYLRSGKTLQDLKIEHGIDSYLHNGKIALNYNMIEAKNDDLLACQCRGLILRDSNYSIENYVMDRFFNLSETGSAADIDWNTASFEEKLDGSLISVYVDSYTNKWCSSTRKRPEADGIIDDSDLTFADLVDFTIKGQFKFENLNDFMDTVFSKEARDYCFAFEITTPMNRIVCNYSDFKLTLLAIRNKITLLEEDPKIWAKPKIGLNTPKTYSFNNIDDMVEVIKNWNPSEHEGVVVKDHKFQRVKVKSPAYTAYNKLRDSLTTSYRGCVEIILLEKDDDVMSMMPEFIQDRIMKLKKLIKEVFQITEKDYQELKSIENMKEFALNAETKLWPAALFTLKRGKTPDLKTFALGNGKLDNGKTSSSSIDKVLELCSKLDPSLRKIENVSISEEN
jgi:hypothetical protein